MYIKITFQAGVAQLVEHRPSKPKVEGSKPFSRSKYIHTKKKIVHNHLRNDINPIFVESLV